MLILSQSRQYYFKMYWEENITGCYIISMCHFSLISKKKKRLIMQKRQT